MTEGEAKVVAALLASADGYCGNCGNALCRQVEEIWPEFPWAEWIGAAFDDDSDFHPWDDLWCMKLNRTKLERLLDAG